MTTDKRAIAGDLWRRARTNALAHKFAAQDLESSMRSLSLVLAALTVIPILGVSLLFEFEKVVPSTCLGAVADGAQGLPRNAIVTVALIANAGSLFLGLWMKDVKHAERASQHRTQMASYATIAQKVRRLEDDTLDVQDATYSLRHLQEMFEMYKSNPCEPDESTFKRAQSELEKLAPLPFGLSGTPPS